MSSKVSDPYPGTLVNMSFYKKKPFWMTGSFFALAFLSLFSIRMGWIDSLLHRPKTLSLESIGEVSEKDTWMNIYQNKRKIGFSHSTFSRQDTGYSLQETVYMRINTMGMVQDINLKTEGQLHPDFTIASINFKISSGKFQYAVKGTLSDNAMTIETWSDGDGRTADGGGQSGDRRRVKIKLKDKPYLFAGLLNAVSAARPGPGDRFVFHIFDPGSMTQQPVHVEVIGQEQFELRGRPVAATKISLSMMGHTQLAWIDGNGDVLKEKGFLGIELERTDRQDALYGEALTASRDLTRTASVASNVRLKNVSQLRRLTVEIDGIPLERLHLEGGRQRFDGNILTIAKESLTGLPNDLKAAGLGELEKVFLEPDPFVQSDHEKIQKLTRRILGTEPGATPLEKARKLMDWIYQNIEKRPVLSLPDALSTLDNRVGDCNEHAVLMAAMARAAGIPCRIEAGLVYLKGRFYYHAWNLVYVGRWITLDSLFGQMPADVTHIRFTTGTQQQQIDIVGVIGKVQLRVIL
jgi:hypothetical protein